MTQKIVKLSEVWDRLNQLHARNYLSQYAADNLYSFFNKAPSVSGEAIYQCAVCGNWMDTNLENYIKHTGVKRTLYTTPQPDRVPNNELHYEATEIEELIRKDLFKDFHNENKKAFQYVIDEFMLEYCPEKMTKEQLENYELNQRLVKDSK